MTDIVLEVSNCYTTVYGSLDVLRRIRSSCLFKIRYYISIKGMKHPKLVEKVLCYFDYINMVEGIGKFPTGWVGLVCEELNKNDIVYRIEDIRKKPVENLELIAVGLKLRDYQKEALDLLCDVSRGIIQHPTGSGKTCTAMGIIEKLRVRTLYVVPNLLLFRQTYDKLVEVFGDRQVGRIGEGIFDKRLINVATVATLWTSRLKPDIVGMLNETGLLILDECHHVGKTNTRRGNTWYSIAMSCPAYYRVGFSATPGVDGSFDHALLKASTGKVLHSISVSELVQQNYLVAPTVRLLINMIPKKLRSLNDARKNYILLNNYRNNRIKEVVDSEVAKGRKVLVLVDRVEEHGRVLAALMPDSIFLYGNSNKKERQESLEKFTKGNCSVMIGTIFGEGFDFPELDTVFIAGGGKGGRAGRKVIQQIGRVLRTGNGKKEALVYDFFDYDSTDDGEHFGMLGRHSKERIEIYTSEGYNVECEKSEYLLQARR